MTRSFADCSKITLRYHLGYECVIHLGHELTVCYSLRPGARNFRFAFIFLTACLNCSESQVRQADNRKRTFERT